MDGKYISCEKDLDLTEGPIIEDCTPCVKAAKVLAEEKSEKEAKLKGEVEESESAEFKEQIASLLRQPRMIEFVKRLKSIEEAAVR